MVVIDYCKRANICGDLNFSMFAVDDFSAKLKPPRSFDNTSVYSYLLITLVSKFEICEIKTTAKGPRQENREILTLRNLNLLQYFSPTPLISINNLILVSFKLFKAQRQDAAAKPIATL